ncbi:MAG: hypothetical protein KGQ93_04735 [Cyanobacteria bacterium REEB459]|nr:hypothetical protein [Cyanobacteria bacterium REEB459]
MVYQLLSSPSVVATAPTPRGGQAFADAFDRSPEVPFLAAILEGFTSGILVLTREGGLLHGNQVGQTFARHLRELEGTEGKAIPTSLWTICGYLEESRDLFPDSSLVLTQDFTSLDGCHLRASVQWLTLTEAERLLFLVMIEEQQPSSEILAAG